MQDNINEIIKNALLVDKSSLSNDLKSILDSIKVTINDSQELISGATLIDYKNDNGFLIDYSVINNILANIEKDNIFYGDVTLSEKDNDIVYGKEIFDKGNVVVITEGNTYTVFEMIIRNLKAGNTTIIVTNGYMYGTNGLIVKLIQSVLEKNNISKYLVQIYSSENYKEVLENFANIDLVIAIGDNNLQRLVLNN